MNILKIKRVAILIAIFTMSSTTIFAQDITGREIMQKVDDRPDGDTRSMEMTMKLINKRKRVRERNVESYSMDIGKDKKTIMFFLYPGDVKGTGFLTWDYDQIGRDDDKWLYLPAMKKIRRISGTSAKADYFMGTDFTYDDMGSRNIDEDIHKLLREETIDGYKCWVIESTSKDSRDIYSKKISWIRKDCLIALKVEYYDKLSELHRQLILSEIEKIDGFWIAKKLVMKNVQTYHETILEKINPKFNVPIQKGLFTVQKLEDGEF